jgi:NADH pyrophosphatase NudC (nudix superfamily)
MPLYVVCSNCGYSEHISHGSKFCPECGLPLSEPVTDTREVCPQNRIEAYEHLKEAQRRFREAGGKKFPE